VRAHVYHPLLYILTVLVVAGCRSPVPSPGDANRDVDGGTAGGDGACAAPGSVADGWPCGCSADCMSPRAFCDSEAGSGFPHGQCTLLCTVGGDAVCGTGAICEDLGVPVGTCTPTCTSTSDCPPYSYCSGGSCLPFCLGDSDCVSGHCNGYSGLCTTDAAEPSGAGIYARCVRDGDCKSKNCGSNGRCRTSCSIADGRCPDGGVCVQDSSDKHSDVGFCFPACGPAQPCPDDGLACSATGIPQDQTACFVPGTSPTCMGPALLINTDDLACGCTDDCSWGAACGTEKATGVAHGFCRRTCVPPDGTPCGTGYVCDTDANYCNRLCRVDSDCAGPGRICGPNQRCIALCDTDDDCLGGHCDPYTGGCQVTATRGAAMGSPCAVDTDCKSGLCDSAGHYCWSLCRVSAQACPDAAVCAPVDPTSSSDLGYCEPPCQDAAGCAPFGLACRTTQNAPPGTSMHCE